MIYYLNRLFQKAEEQARKDKEANALYKYGQREYGRGEYAKAVEALQSAVDLVTKGSALGGEVRFAGQVLAKESCTGLSRDLTHIITFRFASTVVSCNLYDRFP